MFPPYNCSEAKELAKLLALSITFVVSSSSLSIYRKDDIDLEKTIVGKRCQTPSFLDQSPPFLIFPSF